MPGRPGLAVTLQYGNLLNEIPDLAVLLQSQAAPAGITITPAGQDNGTFYGAAWCPADPATPPCSGADDFGIVDYGHRGSPDVFLNSAFKTGGVWNSAQYCRRSSMPRSRTSRPRSASMPRRQRAPSSRRS